jgi:hypothetical protein
MTPTTAPAAHTAAARFSPLLLEALTETVPDWQPLREQHKRALGLLAATTGSQSPEAAAQATVRDLLAAGDTTIDAAVEAVTADLLRTQASVYVRAAADTVASDLASEMRTLLAANVGAVTGWLNTALTAVLDDATRALAAFGVATTADEVVDMDAAARKAWRSFADLETRYADIRRAQLDLWPMVETMGRRMRDIPAVYLRHVLTADTDRFNRQYGVMVDSDDGSTRAPSPEPWPALGSREALRWCAEHPEAGAWVPTPTQLETAQEALAEAERDWHNQRQGQRLERSVTPRSTWTLR